MGQALVVGASLCLAPHIISSGWLGSSASFLAGNAAGVYAASAFLRVWYTNREDLNFPALRLALLIPGGVSVRAKGLLRGAFAGARARVVRLVAMGFVQRVTRWLISPWTTTA